MRDISPTRCSPHESSCPRAVHSKRAPGRRAQLRAERFSVALSAGAKQLAPRARVVNSSDRGGDSHAASGRERSGKAVRHFAQGRRQRALLLTPP